MEIIESGFETGITPKIFSDLSPQNHTSHEDAWEQIQRYGLLRNRSILDLWEVDRPLRMRIEIEIRRNPVEMWHLGQPRRVENHLNENRKTHRERKVLLS